MEINRFVTVAIGVFVAAIVILSIVAPVIHAGTAEKLTYENEGMPYAETAADETHTIVISSSSFVVDDVAIDTSLFPEGFDQFTILYGTIGTVRYDLTNSNIRAVENSVISNISFLSATITISINGTTATITSSDEMVASATVTGITHYISNSGDWVLSLKPVVNTDSVMVGEGQTTWQTAAGIPALLNVYVYWTGTIATVTGSIITYWATTAWSAVQIEDISVNTTELDNGLYRVDSVVLNFTSTAVSDSEDYETQATYTYFLVPASVEYDNPAYIGAIVTTIAGILPVLMLVGVMLFVVGAMISNRRA